jgi:hypothetical protein
MCRYARVIRAGAGNITEVDGTAKGYASPAKAAIMDSAKQQEIHP